MNLERMVAELRNEREALERSVTDLRKLLGTHSSQPILGTASDPSEALILERTYSERLEEYKFLRVELDAIWEQTYTTMNFMFVAIGFIVTAAFSPFGDALILLPCASVLTVGGYKLIRIHTTRVWRIVGYMRCALERKLHGIRWETRLAARNKALTEPENGSKSPTNPDLDRDIFDGHVWILNLVNITIGSLLILIGAATFAHPPLNIAHSPVLGAIGDARHRALAVAIAVAFPGTTLGWSFKTQASYKRGKDKEDAHLGSWKDEYPAGTYVAEAEPPSKISDIV